MPANNFSFINVSEKESEILTKIHEQCFPRYWNREVFTDFFSVKNTFAVLVENGDKPVAMLVYRVALDEAEVLTIAVLPEFRGKKLGKTLVEKLLEHCKNLGVEKIFLEVEVGNDAAIKLYEKAGFEYISRRKLYYRQLDGTLTDAIVMSKKIRPLV